MIRKTSQVMLFSLHYTKSIYLVLSDQKKANPSFSMIQGHQMPPLMSARITSPTEKKINQDYTSVCTVFFKNNFINNNIQTVIFKFH